MNIFGEKIRIFFCDFSAEDKRGKIEEILNTFGRKSRPLIMRIIEEDCANYHRRHKRMMTINHHLNDRYQPL